MGHLPKVFEGHEARSRAALVVVFALIASVGLAVVGASASATWTPIKYPPTVVNGVKAYTTPAGTAADEVHIYPRGTTDPFSSFQLLVPHNADVSAPLPIVFEFHGSGGNANDVISQVTHAGGMTDSWLDRGWVVVGLSSQYASTSAWGIERSRLGVVHAYAYIHALFPTGQILLYGVSMGGEVAFNFMVEARRQVPPIPIVAYAGNSPVLNLRTLVTTGSQLVVLRRSFDTAYFAGVKVQYPDPVWTADVDLADGGHDPMQIDLSTVAQIPMRFYLGTKDTVIPPAANGYQFDQRLTDFGWESEHRIVSYIGTHGPPASFQPADTDAFFVRALNADGNDA